MNKVGLRSSARLMTLLYYAGGLACGHMKKPIQTSVDALLVVVIIGLVPFAWILRDGLGPDSRTSSGLEAISRCLMTFYSGPILIGLVALSILCRLPGRKES